MNIREAILRAADHIEQNPKDFAFYPNTIPDCGTPGCASGWIGHFIGFEVPVGFDHYNDAPTNAVCKLIGCEPNRNDPRDLVYLVGFLNRMDKLCVHPRQWRHDAAGCAHTLRLYADKYHPAPVKTPDWEAIAAQPLDRAVVRV